MYMILSNVRRKCDKGVRETTCLFSQDLLELHSLLFSVLKKNVNQRRLGLNFSKTFRILYM